MTAKQASLITSWIVILVAIYCLVIDKLIASLIAMFVASFFRDINYEKGVIQELLIKKSRIIIYAKKYSAIAALAVFSFAIWSVLVNNRSFLMDYNLISVLIFIILWPFVIIALYHEMMLFKKYGK